MEETSQVWATRKQENRGSMVFWKSSGNTNKCFQGREWSALKSCREGQ